LSRMQQSFIKSRTLLLMFSYQWLVCSNFELSFQICFLALMKQRTHSDAAVNLNVFLSLRKVCSRITDLLIPYCQEEIVDTQLHNHYFLSPHMHLVNYFFVLFCFMTGNRDHSMRFLKVHLFMNQNSIL
jgi:hypothetical protein